MKKLVIFLFTSILLVNCLDLSGQKPSNDFRKLPQVTGYVLVTSDNPDNAFYISTKPVTNREYVTYLCWLFDVYVDYPEFVYRAIPGIETMPKSSNSGEKMGLPQDFIDVILSNANNRNYIFNTKYLDYPLTGVTWNQTMNFFNWLTDRYNEMQLINAKELRFFPDQVNEHNFNTEAYLASQYEGIVRYLRTDPVTKGERRSDWNDKLFFPSFRLPSGKELEAAGNLVKKDITSYKPEKFLKLWINLYTSVKKDTLILHLHPRSGENGLIAPQPNAPVVNYAGAASEFTLDYGMKIQSAGILDIYKELGQDKIEIQQPAYDKWPEKSNLGFMPFRIVAEDKNQNPVLVKRINYDRDLPSGSFTIFRYAMSAVR
jgi:hypothetical protein